jgi:hypothetical protein
VVKINNKDFTQRDSRKGTKKNKKGAKGKSFAPLQS